MADERWLPVVGFEGKYEVSSLGRVRSVDHVVVYHQWRPYEAEVRKIARPIAGRDLRPAPGTSRHLTVVLGRGKTKSVHRLVIEAFIGPCPAGMECCHNNGDPQDNRVENLRWDTRSANVIDAVTHGAKKVHENAWNARLKRDQIIEIRTRLKSETACSISRDYGVSEGAIYQIKYGRTWKGVGSDA